MLAYSSRCTIFLTPVSLTSFVFFFFQAEDGIRDYKVTGVQTCALPISDHRVGELRGVDLPPAHRLGGRRAREPAGVGSRVGEGQEIIVALLGDAEHLLDLGLGLEDRKSVV